MRGQALRALADARPSSYLRRGPSGQSTLKELYQQAASAGLAPSEVADDVARLHLLFDIAVEHGLGGLVHDYVIEVGGGR